MKATPKDHSGQTYGAIIIGDRLDGAGPYRYQVTWRCCGTVETKTQTQVLHYANTHPTRCRPCRDHGCPSFDPTPPEGSVTVPGWGTVRPLGRLGNRYG